MNDELHNLEMQVEGMLRDWSNRLNVELGHSTLSSLHAAVHQELGQRWLADQVAPTPSTETVARTREAVRAELKSRYRRSLKRWISVQGVASLAAAAMIVFCVGIVHYAGHQATVEPTDDVNVLVSLLPPDSPTDSIHHELLSLETDLSTDESATDDGDESLEDVVQEMDQILDEHDAPAQRTSAWPSSEEGVLG